MKLEYGKRIKELREKENVSQRQLAEAIGLTRSSINQFEQQYDLIPVKRLNQIANYFHVSLDYLFNFTNILNYNNNKKEIDFSLSSERLKQFRKLNKLTQKKLGDKLKISPLLVIFAVSLGGTYFGVWGMFLSVPIAAGIKVLITDYIEYKNREKAVKSDNEK